jgi:3'-phosphoadenosine 5'-phosphosulfate sulfotransferase (PAPS reductase)/FAD synthetase
MPDKAEYCSTEGISTKHVVGFSGGIDSQAALAWVRDKFGDENVIALNSNVGGHEHPITTKFVHDFSENVFPVIEVTPRIVDMGTRGTRPGAIKGRRNEFAEDDVLTFNRLAYIKGLFPRRKMQFCTEHLKLAPQRRWCDENLKDKGFEFERYAGVRCDESNKRANTPEWEWDTYFDCVLNYPIRRWTKLECFAFIKSRGEPINPLYSMGFSRIGCAPCINSGKEDIHQWAATFPEMIDKVRGWEEEVGFTFFAPCVPGKAINWVDEVVAWAKTTRGGKHTMLPIIEADADAGQCVSKYGLCE